jgi:hypothetical protein
VKALVVNGWLNLVVGENGSWYRLTTEETWDDLERTAVTTFGLSDEMPMQGDFRKKGIAFADR